MSLGAQAGHFLFCFVFFSWKYEKKKKPNIPLLPYRIGQTRNSEGKQYQIEEQKILSYLEKKKIK